MAQEAKDPAALRAELLAMERQVWEALVEGDAATDARLLAPDFLGVYPSGFSGREDHASQLEDGPSVLHYALSGVRVLEAGADHAMLSYRADYRRVGGTQNETMYVSSLWRHGADGWRNIFSQDTPASDHVVP